jgi:hypothetical protein
MAAVLNWRLDEPVLPAQGRFPGSPEFRKESMIIPFGASIWRGGLNWLSASPIMFGVTPARTSLNLSGRCQAVART